MAEWKFFHDTPPEGMVEDLSRVFSLAPEKLERVNKWARENIVGVLADFTGSGAQFEVPEELQMSRRDFSRIMTVLVSLLLHRETGIPSLDNLVSDLKELNIPSDHAERARTLLLDIEVPKEGIEFARKSLFFSRTTIPTLTDVDIVCDLRSVFSLPIGSQEDKERSDSGFLGFVPMVVISLEITDEAAKESTAVFQLSEAELREHISTLQRSLDKLLVVKSKVQV